MGPHHGYRAIQVVGRDAELRAIVRFFENDALAQLRTRLYPEAVPGLIRLLHSKSRGRIAAAELLGWIGGDAALNSLRQTSESETDERVRNWARHQLQDANLRSTWDTKASE